MERERERGRGRERESERERERNRLRQGVKERVKVRECWTEDKNIISHVLMRNEGRGNSHYLLPWLFGVSLCMCVKGGVCTHVCAEVEGLCKC